MIREAEVFKNPSSSVSPFPLSPETPAASKEVHTQQQQSSQGAREHKDGTPLNTRPAPASSLTAVPLSHPVLLCSLSSSKTPRLHSSPFTSLLLTLLLLPPLSLNFSPTPPVLPSSCIFLSHLHIFLSVLKDSLSPVSPVSSQSLLSVPYLTL